MPLIDNSCTSAPVENDTLIPEQIEAETGCKSITGAVLTVNLAVLDVATGEHVPLTIQRYCLLFKPVTLDISEYPKSKPV